MWPNRAAPVAGPLELAHDLSQLAVGARRIDEWRMPHVARQLGLRIACLHGLGPREDASRRRRVLLHFDGLRPESTALGLWPGPGYLGFWIRVKLQVVACKDRGGDQISLQCQLAIHRSEEQSLTFSKPMPVQSKNCAPVLITEAGL